MSIQWKLIIEYGGSMARLMVIIDGKEPEQVFYAQVKRSIVQRLRKDPMYQDVLETHRETKEEAKQRREDDYNRRYQKTKPEIR